MTPRRQRRLTVCNVDRIVITKRAGAAHRVCELDVLRDDRARRSGIGRPRKWKGSIRRRHELGALSDRDLDDGPPLEMSCRTAGIAGNKTETAPVTGLLAGLAARAAVHQAPRAILCRLVRLADAVAIRAANATRADAAAAANSPTTRALPARRDRARLLLQVGRWCPRIERFDGRHRGAWCGLARALRPHKTTVLDGRRHAPDGGMTDLNETSERAHLARRAGNRSAPGFKDLEAARLHGYSIIKDDWIDHQHLVVRRRGDIAVCASRRRWLAQYDSTDSEPATERREPEPHEVGTDIGAQGRSDKCCRANEHHANAVHRLPHVHRFSDIGRRRVI